jgi:hypothetical protein
MSYAVYIVKGITETEWETAIAGQSDYFMCDIFDNGGKHYETLCYVSDYTYNVAPMIAKAMGGLTVSGLHLMPVKAASILLSHAINEMLNNEDDYTALNPPNGWGNYEGCLDFLLEIRTECDNADESSLVFVS